MVGIPQKLSKGQEEDVIRILRNKLLTWIIIGFTLLAGFTGFSLWGIMQRAKTQMEQLVAKQFEEPRIQKLVREVAADRASVLMTEQIQPEVTKFKAELAAQLQELKGYVEKANIDVQNLNSLFDVYVCADTALNGSKAAYIQLRNIASQQTNYGLVARNKMIEIQKNLQLYLNTPTMYQSLTFKTATGDIPYDKLSLNDIVAAMENPALPDNYRHTCMVYIKGKPKEEIVKKALEVLKTSDSLPTSGAFCGVLAEILETKAGFLDFDGWIEICQKELEKK